MGKVLVTAKIENLADLYAVDQGHRKLEEVRAVEVADALVDAGASTLLVPKALIARLGLKAGRLRNSRTVAGMTQLQSYGAVRLTVQGREWVGDVIETSDELPVLIGQMPLEGLDFVVDTHSQRLIGNPAHGGEQIIDAFASR
jgi:predicted aspartyl protease